MTSYKLNFAALLFFAAFMMSHVACRSVQKYVESGNYDAGINFAVRKLRGKKNKKTKHVKGLELAFERAQERDLQRIDNLHAAGNPSNWKRINQMHRAIQQRQRKVAPLLPCISKDGYLPYFRIVNIDKMEGESRKRAAEYLYARAEKLMVRARTGNKNSAREAWDLLYEIECKYYTTYCEKDALMEEALNLGTTYVLFDVRNRSASILPPGFTEELMRMSKRDLDSRWMAYSFRPEAGMTYDYEAFFDIERIDVSPERVAERSYIDEMEIKDGFDYVLDKRGNVMKDSLGNDIKVDRFITIRAEVLEVHQSKAARIDGAVNIYKADSRSRLDSRRIGGEVLFENYASTFRGDKRALTTDSKSRIGNQPLPFPSDAQMLLDCADRLQNDVRNALRNSRSVM